MRKILALLLTIVPFLIQAQAVPYASYRQQLETLKPFSPEDFALGATLMQEVRQVAAGRQRVLPRTHVFIRSQTKYSGMLYRSPYRWSIRSLFASRLLFDDGPSDHKIASFGQTFDLYRMYGLDGFATFAWPGKHEFDRTFKVLYDTARARQLDPATFSLLFEVSSADSYLDIDENKLAMIADDPFSFRINGKSLISSYVMDSAPPEKIAAALDGYRKKLGDRFLFVPQIHLVRLKDTRGAPQNILSINDIFREKGGLPASVIIPAMDYLRAYAEVCDGLYLGNIPANSDASLNIACSREILLPMLKAVLCEQDWNGKKLFVSYARAGYTSYHGTQSALRFGTKTLRESLTLGLDSHADLIICPEWDELNEDTGFQPQVTSSFAPQRIFKYYLDRNKGLPPTPNPGDDLALPNLIISQRRQISLGWPLDIELLHVPDTDRNTPYRVRFELLDERDQVLFAAPEETFMTAELKDKTFVLASESFAAAQVLRPRLTLDYNGQKRVIDVGLPFTVLRATTCDDQVYYNTPLRDLLVPDRADITFSKGTPYRPGIEKVHVSVDLAAPVPLEHVEIMQNSLEHFAYDHHQELLNNDPDRQIIKFHRFNSAAKRQHISFTVETASPSSLLVFVPDPDPRRAGTWQPATEFFAPNGKLKKIYSVVDWWNRELFIAVEKKDANRVSLKISGTRMDGTSKGEEFNCELPFHKLGEYGVYSHIFPDGLLFSIETAVRPDILPLPIADRRVRFRQTLPAANPNAVCAVRVISADHRIYWSKPFAVNQNPGSEQLTVHTYSELAPGRVSTAVATSRVPVIRYDFSPDAGNVLTTSAGREFYGHLGGPNTIAIDFSGGEASGLSIPFHLYKQDIFPEADRPAPLWEKQADGTWAIRFDGERGNFLVFPVSALPQRSNYKLTFDIFPEAIPSNLILFHHGSSCQGGLTLAVKDGLCEMRYFYRRPGDPAAKNYFFQTFKSNVPLRAGEWQTVSVTYDLENLTLQVNAQSQSFPLCGIGLYQQDCHFGGRGGRNPDGSVPFFKGLLRSFTIQHHL